MKIAACTGDCPSCLSAAEVLGERDVVVADGILTKMFTFDRAGTFGMQHAHAYEHATLCAAGSVLVEREGQPGITLRAGEALVIPALAQHRMTALVDGTVIACVHNVSRRSGTVEVV